MVITKILAETNVPVILTWLQPFVLKCIVLLNQNQNRTEVSEPLPKNSDNCSVTDVPRCSTNHMYFQVNIPHTTCQLQQISGDRWVPYDKSQRLQGIFETHELFHSSNTIRNGVQLTTVFVIIRHVYQSFVTILYVYSVGNIVPKGDVQLIVS